MKKTSILAIVLVSLLAGVFILHAEPAIAAYTVHFICETMNRGNQGSITFSGTTYSNGQSASYNPADYWIVGNPPSPSSDWFFYRWSVMYIGSLSWVDNEYSQSTWFHLRGEAYLDAWFYSPIHTNNPTPSITWGTKQRVTGTAVQYSGQTLQIRYYPQGNGMGPPNRNGVPPFGGTAYGWTTVTVSSGGWDTGLIYPTLPISLGQQLPQTYDVYAVYGGGSQSEVDSNVVSFTLNPATAQIAAPNLSPSAIELGQSVTITDQIFTSAFVNSNDLTGTLTVQSKRQGTSSWIDVSSQAFSSSYGYSTIYGQYGDFYDLSTPWTPTEAGTYDLRVVYGGNHYYYPISNPSTSTFVVSQQSDFGISVTPNYKSIEGAGVSEYTVTLTSLNGFNSEVTLAASASPTSDMTFSFIPTSVIPPSDGTAQSTLRITSTSNTPMNGYTISVTATGGGKAHSTQVTLALVPHSLYTIVFVPLNWQGDLSTFNTEVDKHRDFLIDSVGILTPTNTEIIKIGQNLQLNFDKNNPNNFNGWADIESFAANHGFTGDRYVALTNEAIWGSVEGLSNWGHVVVVEKGAVHVTAHELGHSWGLLDEYNANTWLSEAIFKYGYPIGSPPNSYPGDDSPPVPAGWSYGRAFESYRCIMGSANTQYIDTGNPIDRAFCLPHVKDEGVPVGVRNYEGCSVHVDNAISNEVSAVSGGLLRSVITFYKNGTPPTIHEVEGLGMTGKPDFCGGSQNFSIQVRSQTGAILYVSNISVSFLVSPSQSIGGDPEPFEVDSVTVTWLAGASYQQSVNVTLKDNLTNQTISSENVTIPEILPDIALANLVPYATVVGKGYCTTIGAYIQNKGKTTESFNATVYINETLVDSQVVTLTGANFTTVNFYWNTSAFAHGNYTLKAIVDIVPNETNILDNTYVTLFQVHIGVPGDISGPTQGAYDGTCNMRDIQYLILLFNTNPGSPNWKPNADINSDDTVNMRDIQIAILNFNKHE